MGHIEHEEDRTIKLPNGALPLIKTHEMNTDANPAIYVLRDGRAATVSLWRFYDQKISIADIIKGNHRFGKWCDHVISWHPNSRANTLFIRYEDLQSDCNSILPRISDFLNRDIVKNSLPSRSEITSNDGRWVRERSDWRDIMRQENIEMFNENNKSVLEKYGYI